MEPGIVIEGIASISPKTVREVADWILSGINYAWANKGKPASNSLQRVIKIDNSIKSWSRQHVPQEAQERTKQGGLGTCCLHIQAAVPEGTSTGASRSETFRPKDLNRERHKDDCANIRSSRDLIFGSPYPSFFWTMARVYRAKQLSGDKKLQIW